MSKALIRPLAEPARRAPERPPTYSAQLDDEFVQLVAALAAAIHCRRDRLQCGRYPAHAFRLASRADQTVSGEADTATYRSPCDRS